jgi:hypothetical protein
MRRAFQQGMIVRYPATCGDRLKTIQQGARIVGAFLTVGGEDAADTNGISVQADGRLNVHFNAIAETCAPKPSAMATALAIARIYRGSDS